MAVAEQVSGEADGAPGPRLKQSRSRGDRFYREENAAVTGETTPRKRRAKAVDVSAALSLLVRCDIP